VIELLFVSICPHLQWAILPKKLLKIKTLQFNARASNLGVGGSSPSGRGDFHELNQSISAVALHPSFTHNFQCGSFAGPGGRVIF
jgi:hypothetical protein